jgi:hypothetical protein
MFIEMAWKGCAGYASHHWFLKSIAESQFYTGGGTV